VLDSLATGVPSAANDEEVTMDAKDQEQGTGAERQDDSHPTGPRVPRRRKAGPGGPLRPDDLQPHEGLRYLARLFKGLAVLLVMLLVAELVIGLMEHGTAALLTLMTTATRLVVFAGLLWGAGDIAVLLVESNHDLRASRILLARLLGAVGQEPEHRAPAGMQADPAPDPAPTPRDDPDRSTRRSADTTR